MAFMMPVVKKNYTLYATSPNTATDQRQRRTSDQIDAHRNSLNAAAGNRRRKVKSEGQSLSTSPGAFVTTSQDITAGKTKAQAMDMRRGRGSAPALVPVPMSISYQHPNAVKGVRPSTSAPTGNSPIHGSTQSRSSSISSSSSSESTAPTGKFHSKLVMRLRKTFRIKDTEPTST